MKWRMPSLPQRDNVTRQTALEKIFAWGQLIAASVMV
jgi:hypothetical protein